MKKQGSVSDYTSDRNAELCAAFRRCLKESPTFIDLEEIFGKLSRLPASRFFISEQRASLIIRARRRTGRWPLKNPLRLSMIKEIEARANNLFRSGDYEDFDDAVFDAVNSPAPSFYLTPRSIRTRIYECLAK